MNRLGTTLGVGAVVGGSAVLAWGMFGERNRFTVRHETLAILAPGARPVTILHLSDMHMAPWQRAKQEFIAQLAEYRPDLIVETGDKLGHREGLSGLRRALATFAGVPAVFVHGSNDFYGPRLKNPFGYFFAREEHHVDRKPDLDTTALEKFLVEDLGWVQLDNAVHTTVVNETRFEFIGTGDAHLGWDALNKLPGLVEGMREGDSWLENDPRQLLSVGVTHAPYRRVLNALTAEGADLIFAGHTHGGQVCFPGGRALVTNCDIPQAQAQGLSVWRAGARSSFLQVSAGLGTSIYAPVRFACPPEAVLLRLIPSNA